MTASQAGIDFEESGFSAENQGRPNTNYHVTYDPDNFPDVVCGVDRAALDPPADGLLAPYRIIGQSSGPPTPQAAPRFLFFHLDHLGTPRVITSDSGLVGGAHHYLPFGEEVPWVEQGCTNRREFTGHERDVESELDYMSRAS